LPVPFIYGLTIVMISLFLCLFHVAAVLKGYRDIAAVTGDKAQDRKIALVQKLLFACAKEGHEAKYIVRGR